MSPIIVKNINVYIMVVMNQELILTIVKNINVHILSIVIKILTRLTIVKNINRMIIIIKKIDLLIV